MRLDEHERDTRRKRIAAIKAVLTGSLIAFVIVLVLVSLASMAMGEEEYQGKPLWVECVEAGLPAKECENG